MVIVGSIDSAFFFRVDLAEEHLGMGHGHARIVRILVKTITACLKTNICQFMAIWIFEYAYISNILRQLSDPSQIGISLSSIQIQKKYFRFILCFFFEPKL